MYQDDMINLFKFVLFDVSRLIKISCLGTMDKSENENHIVMFHRF